MIPIFIYQELIGPYGQEVLGKLGEIEKFYQIYRQGADFKTDEASEDYAPAKHRSRQIRTLIGKQAQFLFGKTPEHKISCPGEPTDRRKGKINESDMQEYVQKVLKENLWSGKLIKGAKDCFIGGRVALKADIDGTRIGLTFVPADGFVYETNLDNADQIERVVFFYTLVDNKERQRQRIWVQKYWMEEGRCHYSEKTTDGNGKPIPGEPIVEDEDTGLDRIPAYVIVNDGLSGDTDGESDVETIMDDDSWYSKMRSANLDSLRKSMNQVIWTSGVKPESFEKFTNAPGSIWDIEADPAQASASSNAAQVQVGTISNSFSYTGAYDGTLGNLKQEMYDVLSIPDINLETMKSIVTSGKAMKAIYWPLICRCEEKMTAWRPALEWLTELVLYAGEVFPSLRQKYGEFTPAEHIVSIDNQYPLPEDEESERTLDMQEVNSQNRSRKSYLMKWGGDGYRGMTAEQADEELKQMALERQLLEDSFEGEI